MKDLLELHMKQTDQNFADLKSEQKEMKEKINQLLEFKWQIIGGSAVVSVLVALIMDILTK